MESSHTFEFRPPYMLSGESGKGIGPLRQSAADLGVTSLLLDLRSMSADTLRITQSGSVAPDYLQSVSLWDADGRRAFTGIVTDTDDQWDGKTLKTISTISGAWWWLDQVQLTSIIADDLGGSQERAVYTFPSQDLSISIRAMLERLEEMGVPLRAGIIDPTFQVPQMQFQNGTAESILTTMLQWLPDAATAMRYDADGMPQLDVRRRPSAPHVTLDLSTSENRAGIPRLSELRHLIPTQVKVQTMTVDAAGQIVYGEDVAGDPAPVSPLGRQIIALSGPGRSDHSEYTPRIATLQTITVPSANNAMWTLARTLDPVIASAEDTHGNLSWTSYADYGAFGTLPRGFEGAGTFRLTTGTVLDWLITEFSVAESETRVSGYVYGTYPSGGYGAIGSHLIDINRARAVFSGGQYNFVCFVDFTVPTLNADYTTLTVFVHPEDRATVTPVPGLAANLYAAQSHLPVQGNIPLFPGAPLPLPGSRINIRGGLPKWETMGAMSSGLSLDLRTGLGESTVGRSSRTAVSSLLNQFSRPLSGKIIKA